MGPRLGVGGGGGGGSNEIIYSSISRKKRKNELNSIEIFYVDSCFTVREFLIEC